jgi:hypothetical protein
MAHHEFSDSYEKLLKNLPYPHEHLTLVGISSATELQGRRCSNNEIFVYAGYFNPGKHSVVFHDTKTDTFYSKEFITDVRSCEVLSCKLF